MNNLALIEQEMQIDALTGMFNNLVESCQKKCIPGKYGDGDLTKGESVCLDRCAAKFVETTEKVSMQFQQIMQAQAQAMQQ